MIKFEFSDDKNIIQKFKFILSLDKKDDSNILSITNETDLKFSEIKLKNYKNYYAIKKKIFKYNNPIFLYFFEEICKNKNKIDKNLIKVFLKTKHLEKKFIIENINTENEFCLGTFFTKNISVIKIVWTLIYIFKEEHINFFSYFLNELEKKYII